MRRALSRRWHPILDNVAKALNRITTFVPPPPATNSAPERVLVVQVHPYGKRPSFTLALGKAVCQSLEASGEFAVFVVNCVMSMIHKLLEKEVLAAVSGVFT